ncbi:MAG: HAD family hydrolase [Pseudanabaena sp. M109S1SP2A07QC]|jgi:histidinol-phosphate phosphatase family protein|nr:HAD family hydrolase [Pseudanabaena sp. M109S1SP2A07QC]
MRDWPQAITSHYRQAVFLDRDGTINVDTHYPYKIDDLALIPEAVKGLKILASLSLHIIVVSNQAGIELGYYTQEQMSRFNSELRSRVEKFGGRIDAFYFSPYLESSNLAHGAIAHECSKPSPGMLIEASKDFAIDLGQSFMVGDKTSDIAAGEAVGCTTILVKTGKGGKEEDSLIVKPKHFVKDLHKASLIIRKYTTRQDNLST